MPGVLLDTQTIGLPFDRRYHHPHHVLVHESPTISSVIAASSCGVGTTPPISPSAPHLPSPESSHPSLRFGDLTLHTLTPSPPPGFLVHPPRNAGCASAHPFSFGCLPSEEISGSSFSRPDDLSEEIDENIICRSLPRHLGPGLFAVQERGEFDGSLLGLKDGDGCTVVASREASSACDSEGIRAADAGIVAPTVGNYGSSSVAGTCMVGSPVFTDAMAAFQKYLPSNNEEDDEVWPVDSWPAMDVYSCDDFRMYEFKVRRCMRGRSHDWTECPFAHPGEKARRRDPRKFHYSGTACPDFRKGSCKRGEACEYAHGVFECWLHPARYRTQPCKDGRSCRRRVCFFAHTTEQLRVLPVGAGASAGSPPVLIASSPGSSARSSAFKAALSAGAYDGSPLRQALAGSLDGTLALELLYEQGLCKAKSSHYGAAGLTSYSATPSPTSTLLGHSLSPPTSPSSSASSSPPLSPNSCLSSAWSGSPGSTTHRRHLERLHSFPTSSIPAFDDRNLVRLTVSPDIHSRSMNELISTMQQVHINARAAEPCRMTAFPWSFPHHPSRCVPTTPRSRYACKDDHREAANEGLVQRVELGRNSVEKMLGKSAIENSVENGAPDFDWVNELVK